MPKILPRLIAFLLLLCGTAALLPACTPSENGRREGSMKDITYFEVIPFVQDPPRPGYARRTYDTFAVDTELGKMYFYPDSPGVEKYAPLYITYTPEDWDAFMTALEDCSFTDWKDIGRSRYDSSYHGWQVFIRYNDGSQESVYGSREKSSDKDIQRFDQLWAYIQTFTATFPERMEQQSAAASGTS